MVPEKSDVLLNKGYFLGILAEQANPGLCFSFPIIASWCQESRPKPDSPCRHWGRKAVAQLGLY